MVFFCQICIRNATLNYNKIYILVTMTRKVLPSRHILVCQIFIMVKSKADEKVAVVANRVESSQNLIWIFGSNENWLRWEGGGVH